MAGRRFPSDAYKVPRALEWMIGLRASHAWIFILLALDLAVMGDMVTGRNVWFGPGYLFVICLAAWCLGWRAGMIIGISCTALTFTANGVALYPHGQVELLENLATRFIAIAVVIAVVAGARRAFLREWWLARRDPLTGAFNRQAFFELGATLARSSSWRLLLYADLDGLKTINDEYGHAEGDVVLQEFSDAIQRDIRLDGLFARLGGDEFVLFLEVACAAEGAEIARKFLTAANSIPLKQGGLSRCSVGAVVVPPDAVQIDDVVRMADVAMYRAKLVGASLEIWNMESCPTAANAGRARQGLRGAQLCDPDSRRVLRV